MTSKPDQKHHHGNLRTALVEAGIALLEEGGVEALTLRKCAARAGVSHAAPAHHFDGLAGLKTAIAEEGFRLFSAFMQAALDQGPQTPRGRLKSLCRGYLEFGLEHGGILAVIFGQRGLGSLIPGSSREQADAYLLLRETCAPFVPAGTNALIVEVQVWSLIHGFTLLCLAGEFGDGRAPLDEGLFEQVIALLDRLPQTSPVANT